MLRQTQSMSSNPYSSTLSCIMIFALKSLKCPTSMKLGSGSWQNLVLKIPFYNLQSFATCSQTPWWVSIKSLISRAFCITICRTNMWSCMHEPYPANIRRWSNFLSYVRARARVGVGCSTSWESNKSSLEGECSLEFMMQYVQTHPWLIEVYDNEN